MFSCSGRESKRTWEGKRQIDAVGTLLGRGKEGNKQENTECKQDKEKRRCRERKTETETQRKEVIERDTETERKGKQGSQRIHNKYVQHVWQWARIREGAGDWKKYERREWRGQEREGKQRQEKHSRKQQTVRHRLCDEQVKDEWTCVHRQLWCPEWQRLKTDTT